MSTAVAKRKARQLDLLHEGGGKALAEFNPKQTRMKLGALKGAVGHARKIKDWEALDKAIDEVIAEQRAFTGWWETNVTPGKGTYPRVAAKVPERGLLIPAAAATGQTGISKQQVARWRTRLEDEAAYRETLHESAHAPMWALKDKVRGTTGTGENEWFTPPEYIALARAVLGEIDLDPASSDEAQRIVKAARHFTKADDGLKQEWHGRIWLNPPYAQPFIAEFASKMVVERSAGHVEAAIMLTHNYTDTAWFHELAGCAEAICFTRGRVKFYSGEEVAAPTQGQAFFYFGAEVKVFAETFKGIGFVTVPA